MAAHDGNAACAAATAASTSPALPAEISASGCSSIGETSVKVRAEPTRRPPIQCRVSTATPSTVTEPTPGMLRGPRPLRPAVVREVVVQHPAAVPHHPDLAVVAADDLRRLQPVELLGGRGVEGEGVDPGPECRPALDLGGSAADELVQPERRRVGDRPD